MPSVTYVASGDPATLVLGNGMTTQYGYDLRTLRLMSIVSTLPDGKTTVQNLAYTYDPRGNVTFLANATPVPGASNAGIDGNGDYTFDSLYRLIAATGRQAKGLAPDACVNGGTGFPSTVTLERYTQTYSYDWAGNLWQIVQDSATPWTRALTVSTSSNHAVPTGMLGGKTPDAFFDPGGNLTTLESAATLSYDSRGRLSQAATVEGPATRSYYQHAWSSRRDRKVETAGGTTTETLYVDDVVIERPTTALDRTVSLRVGFGERLALLVVFPPNSAPPQWRYLLEDRLWSVGLEFDAQAKLLTFEEYQPYGCAAVTFAGAADDGTPRYRFVQQELDTATGLYAVGRRCYSVTEAAGPRLTQRETSMAQTCSRM